MSPTLFDPGPPEGKLFADDDTLGRDTATRRYRVSRGDMATTIEVPARANLDRILAQQFPAAYASGELQVTPLD